MVHRGKQIYHCFGCQKGGDIFSFLQEIENIDFAEALHILAPKAGVQLKTFNPEQESLKTKLKDILNITARYYEHVLWTEHGKRAREYLMNERGMKEKTIKKFQLGFAPAGWDNLSRYLMSKKYNNQNIIKSGLVVPKQNGEFYDRFRGRIMFPIADSIGQTIGFTGRLLPELEKDDKAGGKYINTPETPVFNKSVVLYGLSEARQQIKKQGAAIFVEGQMDVISSHQAEVTNVIASSGTALTADHFRILKRNTDKIYFALDADEAGLNALKRAVALAWSQDLSTYVIKLPDKIKDPADLIKSDPQAWPQLATKPISFVDYYLELIMAKHSANTAEGKKQIAQAILPMLKLLPDPIERSHYINEISDKLQVETQYIKEALNKIKEQAPTMAGQSNLAVKKESISPLDSFNEHAFAIIVKYPDLQTVLINSLSQKTLGNSKYEQFYKELYNWYNLTDNLTAKTPSSPAKFTPSASLSSTYALLELKAEQEYGDLTAAEAEAELGNVIALREKYLINQQIKTLADHLKQLESNKGSREEIDALTKQLNDLTQKLNLQQ